MLKGNENSNAQSWELEIACKNKTYLDAIVGAIMKYGMINFEVECIDCNSNSNGYDGRYLVFIWCHWFHNLAALTKDLEKIEKELEK